MGSQKETAAKIIDQGAEYDLALKDASRHPERGW